MMDVVYVLGAGSKQGDFEIQCSVASLVRHCAGQYRQLIIVGEMPRTTLPVPFEYVAMSDPSSCRSANTTNKLRKICSTRGISDRFVLMNDDFFFCRDTDLNTIPHYRSGFLADHIEHRKHCKNGYYSCLVKTENVLKKEGLPTRDFELHVPIVYEREPLYRIIGQHEFTGKVVPLMRSLYCNTLKIEGERLSDLKFDAPVCFADIAAKVADRAFFSVGDGGFMAGSDLRSYLTNRYLL